MKRTVLLAVCLLAGCNQQTTNASTTGQSTNSVASAGTPMRSQQVIEHPPAAPAPGTPNPSSPPSSPGAAAGPSALAECDNPNLLASMRAGLEGRTHLSITALDNVRTVSRTADAGVCTVHTAFSDGEEATYTYTLTLVAGGTTNFLVTAVSQTRGPG